MESDELISKRNKNDKIYTHSEYNRAPTDFERGFYEALDFFQYIRCYFSIEVALGLWPPRNKGEERITYVVLEDGTKVIKWNSFWEKFKNTYERSPHKFYYALDSGNRKILYTWYKRNVNKE